MHKKIVPLLVIVILFFFQFDACKSEPKEQPADKPAAGKSAAGQVNAPDFTLQSVDGKTVKLSDYKGKIVIIDFWATWCPPCRRGIPDLIELQEKYKKDLVVIGISVDEQQSDVPPFVKQMGINYPVVYATQEVVSQYGGISAIPTAFVINRSGVVVDKHVGLVEKSAYEKVIATL